MKFSFWKKLGEVCFLSRLKFFLAWRCIWFRQIWRWFQGRRFQWAKFEKVESQGFKFSSPLLQDAKFEKKHFASNITVISPEVAWTNGSAEIFLASYLKICLGIIERSVKAQLLTRRRQYKWEKCIFSKFFAWEGGGGGVLKKAKNL